MYTDTLARQYPTATVDRDVLFVDDGDLITSAGTAAGIDACLHLVRRELGSEITNRIARRMVVPPQRAGGQRQFIPQPVPDMVADGFGELCDWLIENIDQSHTVAELAARVHMSTRTFARKFTDQTGVTPMRWIIDQRVLRPAGCWRRRAWTSIPWRRAAVLAPRSCCAITSGAVWASRPPITARPLR